MCNFKIQKESYSAIKEWLQILKKYDDVYLRENIAEFKTRYIQQKAVSNTEPIDNIASILAFMVIDKNDYFKQEQSNGTGSEIRKFARADADLHAMDLQIFIEPVNAKTNLEEELENLSETLNDFVDIDDNLIDYFK